MMESSGMKDYHCGSTSRGVDTVQVVIMMIMMLMLMKKTLVMIGLLSLQTNLHFGPSRDQHWSDGRTFVNRQLSDIIFDINFI